MAHRSDRGRGQPAKRRGRRSPRSRMGPHPRKPSGPAVNDRANRPNTRRHPTETPIRHRSPCNAGAIHTGRCSSSDCRSQLARLANEPSHEQLVLDFLRNRSDIKNAEARELTGITCDRGSKACSRQQCRTHAQKDRCRMQREESPARGAPVLTLRRSPRRVRASLRSRQHGNRCAPVSNGARTGEGRCFLVQVRIPPVSQEARSSHHPRSTLRSRDEAGTSRQNRRHHQRTSGHLRSTGRRWKQSPSSQPFHSLVC